MIHGMIHKVSNDEGDKMLKVFVRVNTDACQHPKVRTKLNYTHGKKSKPTVQKYCRVCKKVLQ